MKLRLSISKLSRRLRPVAWQAGRALRTHKRFALLAGVIIGLGIFGIVRFTGRPAAAVEQPPDTTFQSNTAGVLAKGDPGYTTYTPDAKGAAGYGGWTRISPPNKNPVYAYADQVGGITISVSQQPVPKTFYPDVADQVADLAKNFGATDSFAAAGSKVYIGTSAKGPQSLIFVKDDTLLLIKSAAPLSTAQWTTYINSLR